MTRPSLVPIDVPDRLPNCRELRLIDRWCDRKAKELGIVFTPQVRVHNQAQAGIALRSRAHPTTAAT